MGESAGLWAAAASDDADLESATLAPTASASGIERHGLQRVDVAERCGTVLFEDPFRQLEDESVKVVSWERELDRDASRLLSDLPGLSVLEANVQRHLLASRVDMPQRGGRFWFRPERAVHGGITSIRVSDAIEDRGRALIPVETLAGHPDAVFDWFRPSPDGRLLALGISSNGDEQSSLHIVDVETGAGIGPTVPHVMPGSGVWLPSSDALYCARGQGFDYELPLKRLAVVHPGSDPRDLEGPPLAADFRAAVQVSDTGRYVGISAGLTHPRLLYAYDRQTGSWLPAFPEDDGHLFFGQFDGDAYYAVTTFGAPRGRLVRAPVDDLGDPGRWRDIVPEASHVLRAVALWGDQLLLSELVGGVCRLRLVSRAGAEHRVIAPPCGALPSTPLAVVPAEITEREVLFQASSPGRAPTIWSYSRRTASLRELTKPAEEIPGLLTFDETCTTADGHEVVYTVITKESDDGLAPRPALLHGYGGFNVAMAPRAYVGLFAPWVVAGGTYVFAHLRGDGTFGADQWHGGRRERKQNSFDDLIAVADHLVDRGLTSAGQLALVGMSNGGLMAGAALTQRPELFRAVAMLVPITDVPRLGRDRYGQALAVEYGDSRIPEQAAWMRAYSPYHNVRPGTSYPATLIVSAKRDMRVPAWHGRKMAAALLDASPEGAPIHLRVHADCGHEDSVSARARPVAEWLGFLMAQVGLPLDAEIPPGKS